MKILGVFTYIKLLGNIIRIPGCAVWFWLFIKSDFIPKGIVWTALFALIAVTLTLYPLYLACNYFKNFFAEENKETREEVVKGLKYLLVIDLVLENLNLPQLMNSNQHNGGTVGLAYLA